MATLSTLEVAASNASHMLHAAAGGRFACKEMRRGGIMRVVFGIALAHFGSSSLAAAVANTLLQLEAVNQHRWEQWLWTCVFALLPLSLWFVLVQVIGVEADAGAAEASREFLFFSLAVCTLALSDLRNADVALRGRRGYETLNYVSILIIVQSDALYGAFLMLRENHRLLAKLFSFSIGAAVFGFGVSTFTQIFIHHGESDGADS